jgi:hypothetical protein
VDKLDSAHILGLTLSISGEGYSKFRGCQLHPNRNHLYTLINFDRDVLTHSRVEVVNSELIMLNLYKSNVVTLPTPSLMGIFLETKVTNMTREKKSVLAPLDSVQVNSLLHQLPKRAQFTQE